MLGFPMFANPNQVFWYPLAWLRAIPGSFDLYEFGAIVLAAAGAFGLARALSRSTPGAAIAGLIYPLSGFFIGHMGHADLIHPAAWVPYVLWGLLELRARFEAGWFALSAGSLAFTCLGGQPQIFLYGTYLGAAFALVNAPGATGGARAYLLRAGAALALGCGLAAIAIAPALELAARSVRAHLSYGAFMGFAAVPGALPVRLFFPYLMGGRPLAPYSSPYDVGWFAETSAYVGIATLALALSGIVSARRDRNAIFWAAVAVVSLGLTFDGALAQTAYHLPGYDFFKAPGRHAYEFALSVAMLAAYGAAAIRNGQAGLVRVAACCGLFAVAAGLTLYAVEAHARMFVRDIDAIAGPIAIGLNPLGNAALWMPLLGFALAAGALVLWSSRPASREFAALAVAAVALELSTFSWFAYWNAGAFPNSLLTEPSYAARLRAQLAPDAQRLLTPQTDHLGTGIPPNLNLLWNVSSLRGYVPLELARTAAVLPLQSLATTLPLFADADRRLDATGTRFIVVPRDAPAAMAAPLRADPQRFRELAGTGADHVFENRRAFPRAWAVRSAVPADAERARAALTDPTFDARTNAFVEGLPAAVGTAQQKAPGTAQHEAAGTVQLAAIGAGSMQLRVACARECFVVTSDVAYPGWSVTVDGAAQPLRAADFVFRGVAVPAGRHDVVFRYRPLSLALGSAVSLLSLIALVTLGAISARQPRRPQRAARKVS